MKCCEWNTAKNGVGDESLNFDWGSLYKLPTYLPSERDENIFSTPIMSLVAGISNLGLQIPEEEICIQKRGAI